MKSMLARRFRNAARLLCVLFLYMIVASIVLNLFMVRWGFRDTEDRFGFTEVITYTAHRPFAYRVLVPALANGLAQITPRPVVVVVESAARSAGIDDPSALRGEGRIHSALRRGFESMQGRYDLALDHPVQRLYTYFLLFACLVALQLTLRELAAHFFRLPRHVLDVIPAVSLLFLPLTFQKGGFVYDFPDLLLTTAAVLSMARRSWAVYYLVFVLALLNKETAILLICAPWAMLRHQMPRRQVWLKTGLHLLLGAPILLFVRAICRDNPGSGVEWHFSSNVTYFSDPASYLAADDLYAPLIWFPVLFNLGMTAVVAFLAFYRWWDKPGAMRDLLVAYLFILTPLFLANGYRNEVRVFYLIAPAFYVLALHTALSMYGAAPPSEHAVSDSGTLPSN